jgi:hypothetical protein
MRSTCLSIRKEEMTSDNTSRVMENVYRRVQRYVDMEYFTPERRMPAVGGAPRKTYLHAAVEGAVNPPGGTFKGGKTIEQAAKGKGAAHPPDNVPRVVPPRAGRVTPPELEDWDHDQELLQFRREPAAPDDLDVYAEFCPIYKYNDFELARMQYAVDFDEDEFEEFVIEPLRDSLFRGMPLGWGAGNYATDYKHPSILEA